jgi:hypothetical protein
MFLSHLLQNLGVPAAVATGIGIVAMLVRVGMGGKGRPARGDRRQRPSRDREGRNW